MPTWKPDPSFYPSPTHAMEAPTEKLAYVALLNAEGEGARDGIGVIDVDPASPEYGSLVHVTEFPDSNNELHHFGWNACSACLCPYAPHAHVERRYLVVPGTNSSRIHILDTKADPRTETARAACSSSTWRHSRSRAPGRRTAVRRSCHTTSGGTSDTIP